jgi:hypothetical protein
MHIVPWTTVPAHASPQLTDFLAEKVSIQNARAEIYNQLLQALPADASQQQIEAVHQFAAQKLEQQHAGDFQRQVQRAQALNAESVLQPVPAFPCLISPGASPELRSFLTARSALEISKAQAWNQHLNASAAERQAAMNEWEEENAGAISQLARLKQELATSTTNQ